MKMNKFIVYAVFGSELVRAIIEEDAEDAMYLMRTPDSVVKREFNTEAEMKAYLEGLDDASGWMESSCLDSTNSFEKSMIQFINLNKVYKR